MYLGNMLGILFFDTKRIEVKVDDEAMKGKKVREFDRWPYFFDVISFL